MHQPRNRRQQVDQFRRQLNRILSTPFLGERLFVDTTGNRSRTVPSKSDDHRIKLYGERRLESVARVLSIFEMLRNAENLHQRPKPIEPTSSGAVWQAFKGTSDCNACHTCPTHLQLDGQLPTLLTKSIGLQRHIVIEFADCVLMPRSINEIDKVLDEAAGRSAFEDAARLVLNEEGATWQEGVSIFREGVGEFLGPAREMLFDRSGKCYAPDSSKNKALIEVVSGYYEGMYVSCLNDKAIENLVRQAAAEMG